MNAPNGRSEKRTGSFGALGLGLAFVALVVLGTPVWLPLLGSGLAVEETLEPADTALVLEGTGKAALDAVEAWRQQGMVRDVVIVEAPVKTHALEAYWSDFVRWGLAPPGATPPEHVRIVRSPSTQAGQQALAALAPLREFDSHSVAVAGGGGIGSRLVERELKSALGPAGITLRLVRYGDVGRDPARWWQNAEDRRAVLDTWLQVLLPFLSNYDSTTGS